MSEFDFLYGPEPEVQVEGRPRKARVRKPSPPRRHVRWLLSRVDGKKQNVQNKGQRFSHSTGLSRRPEWSKIALGKPSCTLYSAEVKLGAVHRVDTEWGVRLFQWEVFATGDAGEYLDLRYARRAVEKRTLVGEWVEMYNPYGGLGK